MPYNIHDLGDVVRVSATFTDFDTEDLIDPDVVKLSVRTPAGVVTTYTFGVGGNVVKEAVGRVLLGDRREPGRLLVLPVVVDRLWSGR